MAEEYGPNLIKFKDLQTPYYQDPEDVDPVTIPINRYEPTINYESGRLKPFKPYEATNIEKQPVPTEHNTELKQQWYYDNYYSYTLKQMCHPDDIAYKQYHNRTYINWPVLPIKVASFPTLQYTNSIQNNYYNDMSIHTAKASEFLISEQNQFMNLSRSVS